MYCQECGEKLEDGAVFCSSCGRKRSEESPTEDEKLVMEESLPGEQAPTEEEQVAELTKLYIGSNHSYYLSKWEKMKHKNSWLSGNFAALFLTVFWLGYRKMYIPLLLLLVIMFGVDYLVIGVFDYDYYSQWMTPYDRLVNLITSLVFVFFGNKLYQKHVEKKVGSIQIHTNFTSLDSINEAKRVAKKKGGTSWFGALLIAPAMVVVFAIASTNLIPSKWDYVHFMRSGEFHEYPDQEIGKTFDAFFYYGEWDYISKHQPYDLVQFSGGAFFDGSRKEVEVVFLLDYENYMFEIWDIVIDDRSLEYDWEFDAFWERVFD